MPRPLVSRLPDWLPEEARRYLNHTEGGQTIRDLARRGGCNPSTVLRQVRRMEDRREDPLIDAALTALARRHFRTGDKTGQGGVPSLAAQCDVATFEASVAGVLRLLCARGAVLAVAEGMDTAVVVREDGDKRSVERPMAEALALCGWISCTAPGRISRYYITADGRQVVARMIAAAENRALGLLNHGFAEAATPFQGKSGAEAATANRPRRTRYGSGESPLHLLSRLVDQNGDPFVDQDLVQAGERLREDFELAQIGDHLQASAHYMDPRCQGGRPVGPTDGGAAAAKARATAALAALGPILSDMAIRCCCFLDGLEAAEKDLGLAARSGKVVLKIALLHLKAHYDRLARQNDLIG